MTAPSDSSPVLPIPPDSQAGLSHIENIETHIQSAQPGIRSGASPGLTTASHSRRKWLGLLALALLCAGLGFVLWRALAARDAQQAAQMPPAFPVKVERLQSSALEESSDFVGTLDSESGVTLQPESDGRVVQIFVSSGDRVSTGDPIIQLSSERSQADYNASLASVSAAQSARDTARAQLRAAEERQVELAADLELNSSDYQRTATLVERGALPQENLDQVRRDRTVAESALSSGGQEISALVASVDQAAATLAQANANASAIQQDLLDKTVTAPADGIVGDIPIKLGDYVTAGSALATITQNQDLDVDVSVPIDEANRIRVGMPVELMLFGQDEAIATGNIRFVSPTTDATTQTILATARFSSPRQPLQDDQRLEVRVIWDERPGILVPTTAISRLGGQTFVFVPGEPDPPTAEGADQEGTDQKGAAPTQPAAPVEGPPPLVARLKPVTLGDLQGNDYQVLEGLSPGDTVITSGLLNLRDGVPIAPEAAASSAESPVTAPKSSAAENE